MVTQDSPTVAPADVDPATRPHPQAPSGPLHERLAELGFEANGLADRVHAVDAADWTRTAVVGDGSGQTLTALDIVRVAVDAGVSHLRDAERVLTQVRGRPV